MNSSSLGDSEPEVDDCEKRESMISSDLQPAQQQPQLATTILLMPCVFEFLDFCALSKYRLIATAFNNGISESNSPFWPALCKAFSLEKGLYLAPIHISSEASKRMFFSELWVSKNKWSTEALCNSQTFKINVSCRLRPGKSGKENVCLPLHQFLKVRRRQHQQMAQNKDTETGNGLLIGKEDPEEYLDPFLRTLMNEPVLLKPSNRIVDRSVALQCVLRTGRDPFNNRKLTSEMLEPQPQLSEKIAAWRRSKSQSDISFAVNDLKPLIDESAVDPELLAMLLEAEQMGFLAQRAATDASHKQRKHRFEDSSLADVEEMDLLVDDPNTIIEPATIEELENMDANMSNQQSIEDTLTVDAFKANSIDYLDLDRRGSKSGETARIIDVAVDKHSVVMHIPGGGIRPFVYSSVFGGESAQDAVYTRSARELVSATMNGFNTCILCYGQTGSGKTHTFFGPSDLFEQLVSSQCCSDVPKDAGVVVRACVQLLHAKADLKSVGINVALSCQFIEIYDEKVTDLLSGASVAIRRENGELVGASEEGFSDLSTVVDILHRGHSRKRFAATAMNERSSRSHTAFVVMVSQTIDENFQHHDSWGLGFARDKIVKSQIHLVDLAGSERVKKSKVAGVQLKEAVGINYSLLVLGKVINGLVECKSHVPYFESKLTTMLKAAFGGNSRTAAIINCRPEDDHGDETLQSLRFGERCGMISNSAKSIASSKSATMNAIDEALLAVQEQLQSLERRNKQHLESYAKLARSYQQMKLKRNIILQKEVQIQNA